MINYVLCYYLSTKVVKESVTKLGWIDELIPLVPLWCNLNKDFI